jgi:hypothetical protein
VSKLIIAVKSCQRDLRRGDHHVIRSTWGKDAKAAGIDVRFFVGANDSVNRYEPDEVHLNCDDSYAGLPFKTREICKWVSGKRVDHVYLCDTDTFVYVPYLLTSGFEKYDYMGHMLHHLGIFFPYKTTDLNGAPEDHPKCYTWASGGMGYFLSKRATVEAAYQFPNSWAEDLWIGQVVGPFLEKEGWTAMNTRANNYTGNMYSWHFPQSEYGGNKYDPSFGWMEKMYAGNHR